MMTVRNLKKEKEIEKSPQRIRRMQYMKRREEQMKNLISISKMKFNYINNDNSPTRNVVKIYSNSAEKDLRNIKFSNDMKLQVIAKDKPQKTNLQQDEYSANNLKPIDDKLNKNISNRKTTDLVQGSNIKKLLAFASSSINNKTKEKPKTDLRASLNNTNPFEECIYPVINNAHKSPEKKPINLPTNLPINILKQHQSLFINFEELKKYHLYTPKVQSQKNPCKLNQKFYVKFH
jgi:hypothetical protein